MTDQNLRGLVDYYASQLQSDIDRIYAPELETAQAKLERARNAPYLHDAAVQHESARLERAYAEYNDAVHRLERLRAGGFTSAAEIEAIYSGAA